VDPTILTEPLVPPVYAYRLSGCVNGVTRIPRKQQGRPGTEKKSRHTADGHSAAFSFQYLYLPGRLSTWLSKSDPVSGHISRNERGVCPFCRVVLDPYHFAVVSR